MEAPSAMLARRKRADIGRNPKFPALVVGSYNRLIVA
jgi:hypothetical protein